MEIQTEINLTHLSLPGDRIDGRRWSFSYFGRRVIVFVLSLSLVQGQRLKDPLKPTIVCFKLSLVIKKG